MAPLRITSCILRGARTDTTPSHIWTLVERVINHWVTQVKECLDVRRAFDKWLMIGKSDLKIDETRMVTFCGDVLPRHMSGTKHHHKEKSNTFSGFARFLRGYDQTKFPGIASSLRNPHKLWIRESCSILYLWEVVSHGAVMSRIYGLKNHKGPCWWLKSGDHQSSWGW